MQRTGSAACPGEKSILGTLKDKVYKSKKSFIK